jgi:hypothetical protein
MFLNELDHLTTKQGASTFDLFRLAATSSWMKVDLLVTSHGPFVIDAFALVN